MKVGELAPEFKLNSTVGREVSLSEFRGKWVVVFFYPGDFTRVCSTEVPEFNRKLGEFRKLGTVILGISIDSVPVHQAWAEKLGGVEYPLLSDINKEASRTYGVLIEREGRALRGLFIVDPQGILRYQLVNDTKVGRNMEEVLRVLQALQTGKPCPINWKPGDKTLE